VGCFCKAKIDGGTGERRATDGMKFLVRVKNLTSCNFVSSIIIGYLVAKKSNFITLTDFCVITVPTLSVGSLDNRRDPTSDPGVLHILTTDRNPR